MTAGVLTITLQFANMAATSKDGTSIALQNCSFKCGFCKRNVAKVNCKCNICSKVFHNSCGTRVDKCCEQELVISSASDKFGDELSTASVTDLYWNRKPLQSMVTLHIRIYY